jgi:hypothetical protein
MDDLVTWLGAQLDEDERVARAIPPNDQNIRWEVGNGPRPLLYVDVRGVGSGAVYAYGVARSTADHIARWDPARVLAEIAAKRALLKRLETAADALAVSEGTILHGAAKLRHATLETAVRIAAQPLCDRPGWRPEWAPE